MRQEGGRCVISPLRISLNNHRCFSNESRDRIRVRRGRCVLSLCTFRSTTTDAPKNMNQKGGAAYVSFCTFHSTVTDAPALHCGTADGSAGDITYLSLSFDGHRCSSTKLQDRIWVRRGSCVFYLCTFRLTTTDDPALSCGTEYGGAAYFPFAFLSTASDVPSLHRGRDFRPQGGAA